jgi:hypothetical protein
MPIVKKLPSLKFNKPYLKFSLIDFYTIFITKQFFITRNILFRGPVALKKVIKIFIVVENRTHKRNFTSEV